MKFSSVWVSIFMMAVLSSCASARTCPSVDEESISVCRAEKACGGALRGIGLFAGGFTSGYSGQRNAAADDYNACVDRNMAAQQYNARMKTELLVINSHQKLIEQEYLLQQQQDALDLEEHKRLLDLYKQKE